jgi:heme-degrading monooxygenase HmoA
VEIIPFSTSKIKDTGGRPNMAEHDLAQNGEVNGRRGVIARLGSSVGRVAAGVSRAIGSSRKASRTAAPLARVWWGTTRAADAEIYLDYLRQTGLREYQDTDGNRGALALRRVADGRADFLLISFWESDQAIRNFAGDEPNRARFYPEDERFLLEGDALAAHYELVFGSLPRAMQEAHA